MKSKFNNIAYKPYLQTETVFQLKEKLILPVSVCSFDQKGFYTTQRYKDSIINFNKVTSQAGYRLSLLGIGY